MIRDEIKEAIENGTLYDFVRNNQHRISKDELVELVCQLDYTAYQSATAAYEQFRKDLITNLTDYDFFEDDDPFTVLNGQYGESYEAIVTTEDSLPRACDEIDHITEEESLSSYTIYRDCIDKTIYAVKEE